MQLSLRALLFLTTCTSTVFSQQPSPWQGEWGYFSQSTTKPTDLTGQRISISSCDTQTCKFYLTVVKTRTQHCDTLGNSTLTLQSPTLATANLPGQNSNQVCKLRFERRPEPNPDIIVTSAGDTCASDYCTSPTLSFDTTYPQRSTIPYTGLHADECLLNNSPARLATCTDSSLAGLERKWQELYMQFPLDTSTAPTYRYEHTRRADVAILDACDSQPTPGQCLHDRWSADLATMTAKQQDWLAGFTERGDPAEATRTAAKIAGNYRHTFPNGDVQGDHFLSTDTLTIKPISADSIHFDVHLEFYNGHECNLEGGALYRKNGSFVYDEDDSTAPAGTPDCRLAITPTNEGVHFTDINGDCKMYCGARGGWDGEGFLFTERVPMKP